MTLNYSFVGTSIARSGLGSAAGRQAPDSTSRRFLQAMETLETGHWSEAFGLLAALANGGHAPSARIALMLARCGTSLFGGSFAASRREQAYWQRIGE